MSEYVETELTRALCGELLGEGTYRKVYQHVSRPDLVVKIEGVARGFCNVTEWEIWRELQRFPHLAHWFAPCEFITPTGYILLQKKTVPLRETELPQKLPSCFADTKITNFGLFEGRVVAHDYGNHSIYTNGLRANTMRKADWRIE